jgi:hypothetical protein
MRHALAALALALTACDVPLLSAELSIPELRVTLPAQAFPASDTTLPENWCAATPSDPPCIALTLDYDLGGSVPVLAERNVTYDLRLTDVAIALSATEVGRDLSGVRRVTVSVLGDPLDPTTGLVLTSYARPPGAAAPTRIAITGNANLDLGAYLDAGRLPVRVEVVLDAGTPAFLADVQAGFSLEVRLDWGAYL